MLDQILEQAVETIVKETSDQLCGDRHLETVMKKALAPHQNHSKSEAASVVAAIVKMPLVAATTASEAGQNVTAQKDNNNN